VVLSLLLLLLIPSLYNSGATGLNSLSPDSCGASWVVLACVNSVSAGFFFLCVQISAWPFSIGGKGEGGALAQPREVDAEGSFVSSEQRNRLSGFWFRNYLHLDRTVYDWSANYSPVCFENL
jgi:hypothetical protein